MYASYATKRKFPRNYLTRNQAVNDVHVLGSAGVVAVVPNTALHGHELLAVCSDRFTPGKEPPDHNERGESRHIQSGEHKNFQPRRVTNPCSPVILPYTEVAIRSYASVERTVIIMTSPMTNITSTIECSSVYRSAYFLCQQSRHSVIRMAYNKEKVGSFAEWHSALGPAPCLLCLQDSMSMRNFRMQ
jgi:hypothetical protein